MSNELLKHKGNRMKPDNRMNRQAWGVLLLGSLLGMSACGGEEEAAPPTLPQTDTSPEDTTPQPDTEGPDASPQPDATDELDTESPEVTPDVVPDTAPDTTPVDPSLCEDPTGCWDCAPTNELQALNSCTDGSCAPFDNRARLPGLLPDGSLPSLP